MRCQRWRCRWGSSICSYSPRRSSLSLWLRAVDPGGRDMCSATTPASFGPLRRSSPSAAAAAPSSGRCRPPSPQVGAGPARRVAGLPPHRPRQSCGWPCSWMHTASRCEWRRRRRSFSILRLLIRGTRSTRRMRSAEAGACPTQRWSAVGSLEARLLELPLGPTRRKLGCRGALRASGTLSSGRTSPSAIWRRAASPSSRQRRCGWSCWCSRMQPRGARCCSWRCAASRGPCSAPASARSPSTVCRGFARRRHGCSRIGWPITSST
mmetsp:Transcript_70376/g.228785  ORF Transcript_70376/g.228785 Transcript_70376/m.228785 type:complete len:266 (-) Transcript_70376:793-1590(-)